MIRIVLIACLMMSLGVADVFSDDDNCLKNGDFEKGKSGWVMEPGVRVVEQEEPGRGMNNVVEAQLHKTRNRELTTRIQPKSKTKALIISMRVKAGDDFESATPSADQMTLRMERSDRSATFTSRKIEKKEGWQDVTWTFSEIRGSTALKFLVIFHPGQGSVFLDDVVVKME